ncbi:MAG TPA: histidine phosphatase family protein [Flavisolibacter sp.]
MKTLLLVRHAKSSWDAPGLSDFDRPLNERGKNDAPEMAKRLKAKGVSIDLFVSSPAKRAKKQPAILQKHLI